MNPNKTTANTSEQLDVFTWRRLAIRGIIALLGLTITMFFALVYLGSDAGVVQVKAEAPDNIVVGEPFEVTLLIENRTDKPQTLISIGIDQALLNQGLEVQRMVPSYRSAERVGKSDWVEYTFAIARRPVLAPREELPMRITFMATKAGNFTGVITVWTENRLRTDDTDFAITVGENNE